MARSSLVEAWGRSGLPLRPRALARPATGLPLDHCSCSTEPRHSAVGTATAFMVTVPALRCEKPHGCSLHPAASNCRPGSTSTCRSPGTPLATARTEAAEEVAATARLGAAGSNALQACCCQGSRQLLGQAAPAVPQRWQGIVRHQASGAGMRHPQHCTPTCAALLVISGTAAGSQDEHNWYNTANVQALTSSRAAARGQHKHVAASPHLSRDMLASRCS